MAASISMSPVSGYPTKDTMVVTVDFTVQYPGDYYTRFDVYDYWTDELYNTYYGSTLTMAANGSKRGLKKTLSGLQPETKYYVEVSLWNCTYSNPGNQLPGITDTVTFTTLSVPKITIKYYDGGSDGSASGSSVTIASRSRSGWTFVGWATSANTTTVSSTYAPGKTVSAGSSNSSVDLYAVYSKDKGTIACYFGVGMVFSNTRNRKQWLLQTSKTGYSTSNYSMDISYLPTIQDSVTTSEPKRTWEPYGWTDGTSATSSVTGGGINLTSAQIGALPTTMYAVYRNECSITFNSNGGSGTMSKLGPSYAYYNTYGNYTTPSFNIPACTFTPPTGKKFGSWNQKADGSGTTYSSPLPTNYNIVLYAIWVKARPSNWSWPSNTADKPISKGSDMNFDQSGTTITPKPLTAVEWLAFMNRIKEFYAYDNNKTIDNAYWNRAVNGVESGKPMTATQANSARYLISQLSIQTALPSAVSSGTVITAAFINGLKDSLNSIV